MNRKALLGTLVGNVMEFYDFTIYAFMAVQISTLFFPNESKFISIILTFSVFAGGYLTRPFGAVLYGYIGDKVGRKKALLISIGLITTSTSLMAILPTYQIVGVFAPLALVLLRLLQGFSVSGEEGGTAVFLFEANNFKHQEIIGSYILSSVLAGVLLGSVVCMAVTNIFSQKELYEIGWRIPFLLSLPIGILAYIMRLNLLDSEAFSKAKAKGKLLKNPTKSIFQTHKSKLIAALLMVSSFAVPTSVFIVYMPQLLINDLGYSQRYALLISTIGIALITFLIPIFGWVCQKTNKNKFMIAGLLLMMITAPFVFFVVVKGYHVPSLVALLWLAILISMLSAPLFSFIVSIFPLNVRYSGVSISFNLSEMLFSGSAPLIIVFLAEKLKIQWMAGLYLSFFSLVSIVSFVYISKLKKKFDYTREN